MSYNTPQETAQIAIAAGVTKAALSPGKALAGGFMAGAYIAFGGLLAIVVSAGMDPDQWGGLITLVTGLAFSLGLVLVMVAGAELLTGNMMLLPMAVLDRKLTLRPMLLNWLWVAIGNLVGSVCVAFFLADRTGVIAEDGSPGAMANFVRLTAITMSKAVNETHGEQFLRAIGCNWLVCLGVWLALSATDVTGKILAILFPITAFVALGFDHVVANMFFLPAGMMLHTGGVTWANMSLNLIVAFLGNVVGGGVFVGAAYWYRYVRVSPETRVSTLR